METTSKTFWQTACELKIGPVPAPVYLVLAVIVAAATIFGQLPADMVGGIAIMMVMGILLGDIGLKVPILKDIGGPAILSIFIPSAMVYYGLLNSDAIKAITAFTKGANFLYFYISCLVVGSILGMVRTVRPLYPNGIFPLAPGWWIVLPACSAAKISITRSSSS